MEKLSEIQRKILTFIEEYFAENGRPPTNREIGRSLGKSSTGHIDYHLKMLSEKGYIERTQHSSRGLKLKLAAELSIHPDGKNFGIPIIGAIAAGQPLEHFSQAPDFLTSLNPAKFTKEVFALQVRGDSMIEDGILNGDFVIIEPTTAITERDIIVATNTAAGEGGSATLKRFFKENRRIRLQPSNKNYDPIYVDSDEWNASWKVQGKVAAVVRSYSDNSVN